MPEIIQLFTPDTYTVEDDGIRGNGISVVRNGAGVVVTTLVHPVDSVEFIATVPGVHLVFNVADPFGPAAVTVGSLSDPALSPDSIVVRHMRSDNVVTLVSNGSIIEGGIDPTADVIASAIVFSAVTGVGEDERLLETETGFIEAETNTGGIGLSNHGNVQIGGITSDVAGLNVVTSGNIYVTSLGVITLADTNGTAIIHGANVLGNVTLLASGSEGDVVATVNMLAVHAAGGEVHVGASRDLLLGLGGANYQNGIYAGGDIRMSAVRDLTLDGASTINTEALRGPSESEVFISAGHNITLGNATGGQETILAGSGGIALATGVGGAFIENALSAGAVRTSGNILVLTDNLMIANGGLATATGSVVIAPATTGRSIDLGTALDSPSALGISDVEFDYLNAPNAFIGSEFTGNVDFSAPLTPTILESLTVESASEILFRSTLALPGTLSLRTGGNVYFSPSSSFTSTGGGVTAFVDNAQVNDGLGGIGVLDGTLATAFPNILLGNREADTLSGSGRGDRLVGGPGSDILRGFGGADGLIGGPGIDTLIGGLGNDSYLVEDTGDIVTEASGEGLDTVYTLVGYGLATGTSVEVLTPYERTATDAINLVGNDLGQAIYGNNGVNMLVGGGGTDSFYGMAGDDFFLVDDLTDQVLELAGQGIDTVYATGTHALFAGQEIETLSVFERTSTNAINLGGNDYGQMIYGNDGINGLIGGGGTDTLFGMGGDDGFLVDDLSDVVSEFAGGGNDTVYTIASYALGAESEVEALTVYDRLTTDAINLGGNELGQTIYGNDGANIIDGKGGADTIHLLGGADAVRFTTPLGGGNVDALAAFVTGTDEIQLDSVIFTGLTPGALPSGVLVVGGQPSDGNDRLLYNQVTGQLFFDADGNGSVQAILFATLDPGTVLGTNDFFVL